MIKYIDITIPIKKGMTVYPGDPQVNISRVASIPDGDACNVSEIQFGSHTGTHIDAPRHFFQEGKSIDALEPDYFIGNVKVIGIAGKKAISKADLENCGTSIAYGDRIILKTDNSEIDTDKPFTQDFTYLEPEAARVLAEKGIRTLGFDYYSVEKFGSERPEVHEILLGSNIVIIEGLDLRQVQPGSYEMYALPLRIENCDGSPARVILRQKKCPDNIAGTFLGG